MKTFKKPLLTISLIFIFANAVFATTFSVTNLLDAGAGSLRQAITNANADLSATVAVPHIINFTGAGIGQINLATSLPSVANHIDINGGTLGTVIINAGNTGVIPQAFLIDNTISNGSILQKLVINNAGVGPGVYIKSPASNVTIKNCRIGTDATGTSAVRTIVGIQIDGAANGGHTISNNLIAGTISEAMILSNTINNSIVSNWIGLEVTGTNALSVGNGLNLKTNSNYNLIDKNVIASSLGAGILLSRSSYNTITGNYVGTDKTGLLPRGNSWDAIGLIDGSNYNKIGGTLVADRNVCSAGTSGIASGIAIKSGGGASLTSSYNVVLNNYCGVGSDGTTALGNTNFGIYMGYDNATNNIIGKVGYGNIVAYNVNGGVVLENAGTLNNSIRGNSTFCNGPGSGAASANVGISLRLGSNAGVATPAISSGSNAGNVFGTGLSANDTVDLYYTDACRGCTYPNGKTYIATVIANASGNWSYTGGVTTSSTVTVTVTKYNASALPGNTSEFSPCSVTLPVELLSFTAAENTSGVLLQWSTVSETNNDYFNIKRSIDGIHFETIGVVNGNGTTNSIINYTFEDTDKLIGAVYYQLEQVDYDSKSSNSQIVKLKVPSNDLFYVFPSPSQIGSDLTIFVSGNEGDEYGISLIDLIGKTVFIGNASTSSFTIATSNFARGMYTVLLNKKDGSSKSVKLVLE